MHIGVWAIDHMVVRAEEIFLLRKMEWEGLGEGFGSLLTSCEFLGSNAGQQAW